MQYSFGTGVLFGRRTDVSNPTPVQFGGLQGVTLDMSFTTKELFSQYQFPIAIGRGTGKITGKADFAQLNAQAFNDIFFGETSGPTAGEYVTSVQEAQTVGAVAGNTIYPTYNTTYIQDWNQPHSKAMAISISHAPDGGRGFTFMTGKSVPN